MNEFDWPKCSLCGSTLKGLNLFTLRIGTNMVTLCGDCGRAFANGDYTLSGL